ncbi:MAG: AprI/Inh family metalloprotease inhibitor [Pseudolabrys sp.]|jgi:hypothetical protein
MRRGVVILAVLVLSGAAWAQPKEELSASAKAMIGALVFSNAARDKVCSVTFGDRPAKVGYKLTFAPECATLFPLTTRVVGWRYPEDDLLYLLDADGKALVEFSEVEDGMFEAPTLGVGVLFLNKPGMDQPDTGEQQGSGASVPAGEAPAPQQPPAPKGDGG